MKIKKKHRSFFKDKFVQDTEKQNAFIYRSELEYISKVILSSPDQEIGGELFGLWTHSGAPVVMYVTGPGPHAQQSVAFFRQDVFYLQEMGKALRRKYCLQHIGAWHSHHKLGLSVPSGHDEKTMYNALKNSGIDKFFMVLGIIDNDEKSIINGFYFKAASQERYSVIQWELLGDEVSPIRREFNNAEERLYVYEPADVVARMKINEKKVFNGNAEAIEEQSAHSLIDPDLSRELKRVYQYFAGKFNVNMNLVDGGDVRLVISSKYNDYRVLVSREKSKKFPLIMMGEKIILNENDYQQIDRYQDKREEWLLEYLIRYIK